MLQQSLTRLGLVSILLTVMACAAITVYSKEEPLIDAITAAEREAKAQTEFIDGLKLYNPGTGHEFGLEPEQLMNLADVVVVVKGEKGLKELSRAQKDKKVGPGDFVAEFRQGEGFMAYSVFPVTVEEVLKGDVKPGDSLGAVIPVAITQIAGEQMVYSFDDMTPIRKNARYLLYLKRAEGENADLYKVAGEQGKINLDGSDDDEKRINAKKAHRQAIRQGHLDWIRKKAPAGSKLKDSPQTSPTAG